MAIANEKIHVNGRADVYVAPTDYESAISAANVDFMGWTVDGVTIDFEQFHNEIYSDYKGPNVPEDVQYFGATATITMDLIVYDIAATPLNIGGSGVNSALFNFGDLILACDKGYQLNIRTYAGCHNELEGPYLFLATYLDDGASNSFRVGSLETRHHMVWKAIPNATGELFRHNNLPNPP